MKQVPIKVGDFQSPNFFEHIEIIHMKKVHPKNEDFQCPNCGSPFES